MPRRSRLPLAFQSDEMAGLDDAIENLREGTRKQHESGWHQIVAGESRSYPHDLGEIPWLVDVLGSESSDGTAPTDVNASVTIVKTATDVTITNGTGTTQFFHVRAM